MNATVTTCRTEACTAPDGVDHRTLHGTSADALVEGIIRTTHRVHACKGNRHPFGCGDCKQWREQRDMMKAELLRRIPA